MNRSADRYRKCGIVFVCASVVLSLGTTTLFAGAVKAKSRVEANVEYAVTARTAADAPSALFEADNPANEMRLSFSGSGVEASNLEDDRAWSMQLAPASFAYGDVVRPVAPGQPVLTDGRVSYDFGALKMS